MINQHGQTVFRDTLLDIRFGAGLSTRMAGEFANKMAIGAVEALYAQIDPNKLGEMQRAMRITYDYGLRLDHYSNNLKDGALETLVAGYPSHGFVIDRKEANEIFNRVGHPFENEYEIFNTYREQLSTQTGFGPLLIEAGAKKEGENEQTEES